MFYTYKITNNITGEYYIGSHEGDDFLHDDYYGSGRLIEEFVRKYGKENHTKEILGTFDNRLDSMNYEHELVKKKRQIEKDPKILNLSNGGGFNLTRQQVSDYGIPGRLKGIEWYKNRSKRIEEEYYKNPKVCKVCGKIIPYEKKHDNECFCSSSCAAKYNNKLYPKRHMEGICEVCGFPFPKGKGFRRGRFCSNECKREYENRMGSLQCVAMKVPEQYQKYYTNPKYGVKEYRYGYTPLQNYLEENKDKILRDRAEGMSFRELGIKYEVSDSIITNCVNKWKNEHLL